MTLDTRQTSRLSCSTPATLVRPTFWRTCFRSALIQVSVVGCTFLLPVLLWISAVGCQLPRTVAGKTPTLTFAVNTNVGLVEGVSPATVCLTLVDCRRTVSSKNVGVMSDRLQVQGVDAGWSPAQVVQLLVSEDRAYKTLVSETVGSSKQWAAAASTDIVVAITTRPFRADPEPARRSGVAVFLADTNFVPKAGWQVGQAHELIWLHGTRVTPARPNVNPDLEVVLERV